MATVTTGSASFIGYAGGHTSTYRINGSWSNNSSNYIVYDRYGYVNGGLLFDLVSGSLNDASGSYTSASVGDTAVINDSNCTTQAKVKFDVEGTLSGSLLNFKSYAEVCTASTPSVGSITQTTASVSCDYLPNVNISTTSAQLQYKRTVDSTWTDFGSPKTDGTGYSTATIGAISLTGLTASTSYDVRLSITRTTTNSTTATSATYTFVTLAGTPAVTTDAASSVAATTATLNATVTLNAGTNTLVYWKYDTVNPPTANTTSTQSVSGDGSFSLGITGLTASTPYYAKAYTSFDTPSGSPTNGSVVSFTTDADPAAESLLEDHVLVFDYDAKYGTARSFVFSAPLPSATSSNGLYTGAAVWSATAAEELILIDGALSSVVNADGRATNAATQISGPYYEITLAAAELQGEVVQVYLHDSGAAARDVLIRIRTKQRLGQVLVDASNLTNSSAVTYTGVGTGHGLSCVGGATGLDIDGFLGQMIVRTGTAQAGGASTITLDASASATNSYYLGQIVTIVSGTGAGQSRVIVTYVGATQVATVDSAWATNPDNTSVFLITATSRDWYVSPGAELTAIPTYASSYAKMLQFLWQRFTYKRTQTATTFTMTKVDDSTALGTGGVSDNGTTETHNRIS